MRGKSHDVTIRSVEDTRSWIMIGLNVLSVPLMGVIIIWTLYSTGIEEAIEWVLVLLGILIIGGLASLVSIFSDATYLREVKARWQPDWWKYIGIPVGLTLLGTFSAGYLGNEYDRIATGLFLFAMATWIASAVYIKKRHDAIGVP